jgi:hypothetical protein
MTAVLALLLAVGVVDAKPARTPTVLAGAERLDVRAQYRAWAAGQGLTGPAGELVCKDLAEAVLLCFATETDGAGGYLTEAGRGALGKGKASEIAALERAARIHAKAAIAEMERRAPVGFPAAVSGAPDAPGYWVSAREDGRAHAPLLDPAALTARFGKSWVVAVPTRDLLVVWVPGEPQFDKVMAVGVRRAYDDAPDTQVSPLVYRWTDEGWKTWGAAVPVAPTTDPLGAPDSFP